MTGGARILADLAMLAGAAIALLAGAGLLRFSTPYARFHAAGKASPVALLLASAGAAPLLGWKGGAYLAMSAAAMIVTLPVGVHLLFRAVYRPADGADLPGTSAVAVGWHTGAVADVRETNLPGVGVRHDFVTSTGDDVSVLVHHDGRREIMIYDGDDPDECRTALSLSPTDAATMNELLGGSRITEAVGAVQHEIEGLVIDWITVDDDSPAVGTSIADGAYRTRTGASIVAVVRDDEPTPAPGPGFVFEAADVAVAVGTFEGLSDLRRLLAEPA